MSSATPLRSSSRRSMRSMKRRSWSSAEMVSLIAKVFQQGLGAPGESRRGINRSAPLMGGRVLRHALLHPGELLLGCLALIARFPGGKVHAVDQRTRGIAVGRTAGFHHPVGQAVAAETG